jgi:hypothetical protein
MNRGFSASSPNASRSLIHCSVNAVFKVNEGIGRPETLADLFPRHHLAGPLEERGENLEGSLLELDFVAVAPHFTASKVYFKLSDTEARNCYGWYLHGGHNQLFDFDPNPVPNRCQPGSRL